MKREFNEYIEELSKCEIFVFGSNEEGHHVGGAARMAYEKFGAEWGVGLGPTGRCYAIPTMHKSLKEIKTYVDEFIDYVKQHPNNRFIVTRIGCGAAGFKDEQIAPFFLEALLLPNITLHQEWIFTFIDLDLDPTEKFGEFIKPQAPSVITEDLLHELTQKYAYPISTKQYRFIPSLTVRYIIDRDKFGYTSLANCFFYEDGGMYVWDSDEEWKDSHNQDVVEATFGDECYDRGYAHRVIFAGVPTGVTDKNGDMIYTGDVLHIGDENHGYDYALGAIDGQYLFLLDNHAILLSECEKSELKRIGTVFYQLDWCEDPIQTLNERTMQFQGWRDTSKEQELKKIMAKFTPNFDQEKWKYQALEILGVEFNWNKK